MRDDVRKEDEIGCEGLIEEMPARVSTATALTRVLRDRTDIPNDAIKNLTRT